MRRILILATSVALLATACGSGAKGDTSARSTMTTPPTAASTTPVTTTEPSPTTTTTVTTTTTLAVVPPLIEWDTVSRLPPRSLGTGWAAGAAGDGSTFYVLDSDPSSDALGCEGMPVRFLWSIDPETGERLPVTGDGVRLSSAWISPSPSGQVVVVGFCEEYVHSITVFDVKSPSDLIDGIPVTAIPTEFIRRVTWAGEDLLIASEHPSIRYTGEVDLTLVKVDTGQSEFLLTLPPESPAEALTERGHLVSVEGDSVVVRTRSLEIVAEYPGSDFAVSADGSLVAVVDGPTVSVGPVGGTLAAVLSVPEDASLGTAMLSDPVWSAGAGSMALVSSRNRTDEREVIVVELSGRIVVTGSGNVVLNPLFLPGAVVVTQCGTDGCQIMITDLDS